MTDATDRLPTLVILAGGENTRMWPLHEKSLFRFLGRPLLELQIETLMEIGFENVVVVCNPNNRGPITNILESFGHKIKYRTFVQESARGMGDALLTVKPLLEEQNPPVPVYVFQVHDVVENTLHQNMLAEYFKDSLVTWMAAYEPEEYFPGGYLKVDQELNVHSIVEKPKPGKEPSKYVNIVAHIHPDLGSLLNAIESEYANRNPADDHYERAMAKMMTDRPFRAVPYSGSWSPIKHPWQVLKAMEHYLGKIENHIAEDVLIEEGVHISGTVIIESGVRILHGADIRGPVYIGPNTLIGQYANIRQSMISEKCTIGLSAEVNRSYVGRGAEIHSGKALDSILADNANVKTHINLSAGMVTANYRRDACKVKSTVKGERIETDRTKLGSVIGEGAFVGVGAMLMPGVKVGRGSVIGPLTLVMEDVPDHTSYYSEQKIIMKPVDRE